MAARRSDTLRVVRASHVEIVITRIFNAPAPLVFDAWTQPDLVRRWWAPASRGVAMLTCEADVRPGGTYRYVLGRPQEEPFAFSGRYLEVERPNRLVYTQSFEPLPGEAMVTVVLEQKDGATTLVSTEKYPSKEALDGALSNGMEEGMRDTLLQLDDLLAADVL